VRASGFICGSWVRALGLRPALEVSAPLAHHVV
jgi:hypothetical protein